jgi:putative DNA primase/helicase
MRIINDFLREHNLRSFDVSKQDLKTIGRSVINTLIPANESDPVLFRHGNALVWLESDDHGRPVFREITQDRMRALLGRRYRWYRFNRNGDQVPKWPPMEVVRDLLAFPNVDLPVVDRIVSVPVFAPDGTIQIEAGYNAATRSIFLPRDGIDAMLPVSDSPDNDEMATALSLFCELVVVFPFVDSGKTHTLAALLVPFVRALIKGPTPLHLV